MRALKLTALVLWLSACYIPASLAKRLGNLRVRDAVARTAYFGVLHIIGIRLSVCGRLSPLRPLLLVTNHTSYLDPHILGSQGPIRFTPKSEIGGWFGIGAICRLLDCVFIDRRASKTKNASEPLRAALAKGEVICLFPEASTGDGIHTLPFKSSFFGLAEHNINDQPPVIQPAAISFTHAKNLPLDRTQRPQLAWYGDMNLLPHLWQLLALAPLRAQLVFLEPITPEANENRKTLAARCQKMIEAALEEIRRD